jgi:hypothetical protein
MQAVPKALSSDIIHVLHSSADRYTHPDSLYGYGVPDIVAALSELQDLYTKIPENGVLIYPNPTSGDFEIVFSSPTDKVSIEIFSITGKLIFRQNFNDYAGRTLIITELQHREQGIYFLKTITGSGTRVRKIIKLRN